MKKYTVILASQGRTFAIRTQRDDPAAAMLAADCALGGSGQTNAVWIAIMRGWPHIENPSLYGGPPHTITAR